MTSLVDLNCGNDNGVSYLEAVTFAPTLTTVPAISLPRTNTGLERGQGGGLPHLEKTQLDVSRSRTQDVSYLSLIMESVLKMLQQERPAVEALPRDIRAVS